MKLNNYLFFGLVIGLLTISLASAQEFDYRNQRFKQGDNFNFLFPCVNNGTFCSSNAICSATAVAPDNTIFFSNVTATLSGTLYNITLSGVFPLGYYRVDAQCYDGSQSGVETIYPQITPTGDFRGFALPAILGIVAFLMLGLGLLTKNAYFGVMSGFLFMFTGAYIVIYGFNNIADSFTQGLGWTVVGIGLFFTIVGAYEKIFDDSGGEESD